MSDSPWRFLRPLSQRPEDRELLQLTRAGDLQVLINMIAASRVVLLYAASGSGKSSVINAGIVPFFSERGYAIVRTRPRPPASTDSPVEAFRQCAVRDYIPPAQTREASTLVRAAKEQVAALPLDTAGDLRQVFTLMEPHLEQFISARAEPEVLAEQMAPLRGARLKAYLAGLLKLLAPGDSGRLLVICDQFEELFVHYANTPELADFVQQLGEAWSDSSLKVQFLFSMREDWVGSMIEFHSAIPDIFTQVLRLPPVRESVARAIITHGLQRTTYTVDTAMCERLLDDLASSYSTRQAEHRLAAGLPLSPSEDGFVELPAVQLVCDELWRTRDQRKPFSNEHYEWLREYHHAVGASPVEAVLNNYLDAYLNVDGSNKTDRELQLDLIYLMTDRVSHRRAISEDSLLRELRALRGLMDAKNAPTRAEARRVLEPLCKARFVRREEGALDQHQYELVHDFAVRAIVRSWDRLDRERTIELGRLQRIAEAREKHYTTLTSAEDRMLRFLVLGPAIASILAGAVVGVIALSSAGINFETYVRAHSFLSPMRWIALASAMVTFGIAVVQRHTLGAWFSGLLCVVLLPLLNQLLPDPTDERLGLGPAGVGEWTWIMVGGLVALMLLVYPRLVVSVSRATNGSERVQKILLVSWTDTINYLGLMMCYGIGVLALLVAEVGTSDAAMATAMGTAVAVFAVAHAAFQRKRTWHGLLRASEHVVRLKNGDPLPFSRAIIRSVWYSLWLAGNAVFLVPLLLLGPLSLYFFKDRMPYDLLSGTKLVHMPDGQRDASVEEKPAPAGADPLVARSLAS